MHLESATLRSYLDNELNSADRVEAQRHLSECDSCRDALNEEEKRRARVQHAFQALAPENEPNTAAALARLRQKQSDAQNHRGLFGKWLRPATATLAAICIVALFSVPAVRVWASNFLSLFRVQHVSVVQIDPAGFRSLQKDFFNEDMEPRLDQFFSDALQVHRNGERKTVGSIEEAGRVAGFGVRFPSSAGAPSRIFVEPSSDLSFVLDIPRLQALLEDAGRGDVRLPESVNGQMVTAHIPASVAAFFGDCPVSAEKKEQSHHGWREFPNCRVLMQLPGPTVAAPPDFDIVGLSSTMMQILGMPPAQARAWSESIDWTSTLVLPVPRDPRMKISDIEVDGIKGTLITVPERHGAPAAYHVLWVRDGVLYTFLGQGNADEALQILNTMN